MLKLVAHLLLQGTKRRGRSGAVALASEDIVHRLGTDHGAHGCLRGFIEGAVGDRVC